MGLIPTGCLIRSSDRCLRHVLGNRFPRSVFPCKKCGNTCESVLSLTQVEFYQYLTEVALLLLLSPAPPPGISSSPTSSFLSSSFSSFFLSALGIELKTLFKVKNYSALESHAQPLYFKTKSHYTAWTSLESYEAQADLELVIVLS